MTLPFKPIQDIVVCRKDPAERLSAAGLHIPHVNDPDRQQADDRDVAEVLGVGDGKLLAGGARRPMSVREGDKIIFGRNKGQAIRLYEQDYCVLREEHVIGRLDADGTFRPLNGVIVAQIIREEQKTSGGVILPASIDERDEALVIAVGPGDIGDDGELEPMSVREGDRVLYNSRMGEPFYHDGKDLVAMREAHIVCIAERARG